MIKEKISRIRGCISSVCLKAGLDPNTITIVVVGKARTPEQITEVIASGITDIGENRVQEALSKYSALRTTQSALALRWHLVGHLQTNKATAAVKIFALIHSVDSLHLAQELDKQAAKINKTQDILIQVNTSDESTKFGLKPDAVIEVIKEISQLNNINIKGLMTIAPIVDSPNEARPYFRKLREILEKVNAQRITHNALRILSMGMSDDFEVAIEEGANMLRIGRAIFEY